MKNKMINNIQTLTKAFLVASVLSTSTLAEDVLTKNRWLNIGYSNAKDVMLSGATTATIKGYSALFTNPAGLATNYAAGMYVHTSNVNQKNPTSDNIISNDNGDENLATTQELDPADNMTVGLFYKSFVAEIKPDVHQALGVGYGFETNYGLFSFGANYVTDQTIVDEENNKNYLNYGMGDYYTAGFQWQRSFIGIDDFYAVYFGLSQKGQGVSNQPDEQIAYVVSPTVQRFGLGLETNMFASTVLLTLDMSEQSFKDIDDKLSTQAVGLKWMIWSGFSLGLGASNGAYTTDLNIDTVETLSVGIETVIWQMNLAVAALQKTVKDVDGDTYSKNENIHIDISFAF
jgi:hypothetical protein